MACNSFTSNVDFKLHLPLAYEELQHLKCIVQKILPSLDIESLFCPQIWWFPFFPLAIVHYRPLRSHGDICPFFPLYTQKICCRQLIMLGTKCYKTGSLQQCILKFTLVLRGPFKKKKSLIQISTMMIPFNTIINILKYPFIFNNSGGTECLKVCLFYHLRTLMVIC